jgi:hypothetical protein
MRIVPHLDIRGAAICFSVTAHGREIDRVISEADAELALLMAEALKEDRKRFPPDDIAA